MVEIPGVGSMAVEIDRVLEERINLARGLIHFFCLCHEECPSLRAFVWDTKRTIPILFVEVGIGLEWVRENVR